MYNFALYRPGNAMNEMVEIFDLQGSTNTISLHMNDPEAGYVQVNSIEVHDEIWSGDYFSDVPISIKAVPKFGYQFSHWETSPSLSDSVNLFLNQDMTMIANFSQIQNPFQELVVINEINYHSSDDFDSGDWVELYNNSNQDIDISQWKFLDSDDSHIFTISENIIIESGGSVSYTHLTLPTILLV